MPPAFLQSDSLRVDEVFEAAPAAVGERRAAPPDLVVDVDVAPGETAVLAVRHPSGALTFHPSAERTARRTARRAAASPVARFRVPVRRLDVATGRRGAVAKVLKVVVLKVAKAAVDAAARVALPRLASAWEKRTWTKRGLREGWSRVSVTDGKSPSLRLETARPTPVTGQRTLVLLHGTFSHAAGAFGDLAATDFFRRVAPLYGPRIFAFNHFTVSRSPAENVAKLLGELPAGDYTFDAVTHSRGGLVLRSLVEQRATHGQATRRVQLGHAVLVAAPNDGTPLASPARWEGTVGWLANLLEVFPDNPFTLGAEFVSEALVWLASHLVNDLPGLRAMDGAGPTIDDLQAPPGPPASAYSALVSNFHPDDALWQRALDVGVDTFFGSANDLVVPSEGGWRTDREGSSHVPRERIGCYGPGGNLDAQGGGQVNHVNFFGRRETADFLARALNGEPQTLSPIDPAAPLPDRRFGRRGRAAAAAAPVVGSAAAAPAATAAAPASAVARMPAPAPALDDDTFHLIILEQLEEDEPEPKAPSVKRGAAPAPEPDDKPVKAKYAQVLASYGGARVLSKMRLSKGSEGPTAFGQIIRYHTKIKNYTDRMQGTLPDDEAMMRFGGLLFETLFHGDVRRLYDEARSRQRGRRLDLVLTSMIPWIAEKPWEFAYDTVRASFLATEEIHFVRNVLTAVPADPILTADGPLRILVAAAQPVGFGQLSIEQEVEVIRRGFEPLIEAGLVVVEVLARATPAAIHGYLSTGRFNVVHFIGHGVFDETKGEGCLVFEDERGGAFQLGQRSVREIFCQRGLSLVFLNACQSATGGRSDFNKGVAQSLVAHGLPALVANQYSVLDSSATSFAQQFYWSLGQGQTLGQAAREARIAVNYALQGELIDWAIPVLYARDANRRLCAPPADGIKVPTTSVRASSRRAIATRRRRIAVWDVDDVFPALEQTLDRLNAAQGELGFELVHMSAPLDAWDFSQGGGTRYLWADRVAKRLQSKTVELRVDLLVCITRHWLRDDEWVNLYAWWPEGRDPHVAIISWAGFEELAVEGPQTDRVIANALVSVLAGFFGDVDSHPKGPKDCPLFLNKERDARHLFAVQRFDADCRRKLRPAMRAELPALEALLSVFD